MGRQPGLQTEPRGQGLALPHHSALSPLPGLGPRIFYSVLWKESRDRKIRASIPSAWITTSFC